MNYRSIAGLLAVAALVALAGAAACDSDDSGTADPESFEDFADDIAGAAEDGDAAFFIERLGGDLYVCSEDDARYTPEVGGPELDLCLTAGEQFDSVFLAPYPGPSLLTSKERLGEDIQAFFNLAAPDERDQYGDGGTRLWATATAAEAETPQKVSLLTALIETTLVATPYGRVARALYWEYRGGRWVIVGEVGALPPLAVDLIEPTLVPSFLADYQRYGDIEPTAPPTTASGTQSE